MASKTSQRGTLLFALLAVGLGQAQTTTTTTGGTTSTATTNGTAAGSTNPAPSGTTGANGIVTSSPPVNGSTPGATGPRPIFISGAVLTDDGSLLPGSIDIQSICGALRRTMGYATAAGTFSFQWSTASSAFGDASQLVRVAGGGAGAGSLTGSRNGSRGMDPLANCELLAAYPGYSSSKVSLYNRAGQDNYDVGAIILHLIQAGEGRTVSVLALRAPKGAKKSFDRGNSLAAANKLPEAAASFQNAVALYPDYADAWLNLGKVQWQMATKDSARTSFQKALNLDGKLVGPWQELGFLACDDSKWEDAARFLEQAVRLDPLDSPNAWYYNALANYNLGRFEQAERSVRAEMKLDRGKNPREDLLLGLILIARRDPAGGAAALRNYIASAPQAEDVSAARRQLARLEGEMRQ